MFEGLERFVGGSKVGHLAIASFFPFHLRDHFTFQSKRARIEIPYLMQSSSLSSRLSLIRRRSHLGSPPTSPDYSTPLSKALCDFPQNAFVRRKRRRGKSLSRYYRKTCYEFVSYWKNKSNGYDRLRYYYYIMYSVTLQKTNAVLKHPFLVRFKDLIS